jgi:hypothetical protein
MSGKKTRKIAPEATYPVAIMWMMESLPTDAAFRHVLHSRHYQPQHPRCRRCDVLADNAAGPAHSRSPLARESGNPARFCLRMPHGDGRNTHLSCPEPRSDRKNNPVFFLVQHTEEKNKLVRPSAKPVRPGIVHTRAVLVPREACNNPGKSSGMHNGSLSRHREVFSRHNANFSKLGAKCSRVGKFLAVHNGVFAKVGGNFSKHNDASVVDNEGFSKHTDT